MTLDRAISVNNTHCSYLKQNTFTFGKEISKIFYTIPNKSKLDLRENIELNPENKFNCQIKLWMRMDQYYKLHLKILVSTKTSLGFFFLKEVYYEFPGTLKRKYEDAVCRVCGDIIF